MSKKIIDYEDIIFCPVCKSITATTIHMYLKWDFAVCLCGHILLNINDVELGNAIDFEFLSRMTRCTFVKMPG